MPPLRKKGRGGGGGKTEAPLPGEIPGTSPSVSTSLAKKEKERRSTPTIRSGSAGQGLENLGVFVSRSFQKDRGEKKLLEASRTSLHLAPGAFQRSLRPRRAEASSTDSTPRVIIGPSARREDREKRASISSGYRASSASKAGREEQQQQQQAICRASTRDTGEQKILYRRSSRALGVEEKLVRRVAGGRDERSAEFSTRYNSFYPGISSSTSGSKIGRDPHLIDGASPISGFSQRSERFRGGSEVNAHLVVVSPASPVVKKKSPRPDAGSIAVTTSTSPVVTLPVKSSCKCGAFRSSENSASVGILSDDRRRGLSPLSSSKGTGPAPSSGRPESRERKSRDLTESTLQESPPVPSDSQYVSGSGGGRTSTPNLLHGRLALLEGRVTQIAAELKATKDLLESNNPACSKVVLTDIQSKISGIEKAINYRLARECGLLDQLEAEQLKGTFIQANDLSVANTGETRHAGPSDGRKRSSPGRRGTTSSSNSAIVPHGHGVYGKVSRTVHNSKALAKSSAVPCDWTSMAAARQLSQVSTFDGPDINSRENYYQRHYPELFPGIDHGIYADEFGGSAPSSQVKPVMDYIDFEERLYPHQKLLRSKPSVQQKIIENRAALHQKLLENSVLLRNKLAALEERDGLNCEGTLAGGGAAEFLSSLRQQQYVPRSKAERDFERSKAGKVDCGSSGPGTVCVDSCSHPFELQDNDGGVASHCPKERRRSSRDGRRLSSSRRSFSGLPVEVNSDLIFQSSDKVSTGGEIERRKSSEKRKSISRSTVSSPDSPDSLEPTTLHGTRKAAMLEPSKQVLGAPHHHESFVEKPRNSPVNDLECTETLLHDEGREKETSPAGSEKKASGQESDSPPRSILGGEEEGVDLACDESLSSDDCNEEVQDDHLPTQDDEEQPYLGECEDNVPTERMHQIGEKVATAGWFISEGDGILLAHDDASCSFYDAANMEGKSKFKRPPNLPSGTWRDCWLIRAAGSDGTLNKYVVAASASNATESAFCSWNFYDRRITAFHFKPSPSTSPSSFSFKSSESSSPEQLRLGSSRTRQKTSSYAWYDESANGQHLKGKTPTGSLLADLVSPVSFPPGKENDDIPFRWYRPCSPLIASAATRLKTIALYDVRDGDLVMKWDVTKRIAGMEFSSPIQWRNKGKLVVAEEQGISVWDVNSMTPQCAHILSLKGHEVQALHIRNCDAESIAGVRQRSSSRDQISGDGVLCTEEAVNILDFRIPAGVALKIPTFGVTVSSVSANGELVFAGVSAFESGSIDGSSAIQSKVIEWSIKQGKPMSTYKFPKSSVHRGAQPVCQVWGTSDTVIGVSGDGLFMFDSAKGSLTGTDGGYLRESLGTDGLVDPSFDHSGNRVLLISRDKPASWCHWP